MRVYIDGTDITNLIAYQGLKIGRHDVDGPNAGRNLAGTMIRRTQTTTRMSTASCKTTVQSYGITFHSRSLRSKGGLL